MTRPSVMDATTRITPLTAGTGERIDLVHPANELGPSAAKGGQRGGRGVTRRRSVFARPWRERLCLLSLATYLFIE